MAMVWRILGGVLYKDAEVCDYSSFYHVLCEEISWTHKDWIKASTNTHLIQFVLL